MDIRQLRYFIAVAEEGQLTRAAQKLHIAQPPLGQQIRAIEKELNTNLFERGSRHMELTEAGKSLYKRAVRLMNEFNEMTAEVKDIGEGLRGELTIGSNISCFPYLAKGIHYFREHYPNVTIKIVEAHPSQMNEVLKNRDAELAFVRIRMDLYDMSNLSSHNIRTEPFVLIIPAQWDRDPDNSSIEMKEAIDFPLIVLHNGKRIGEYEILNEFRRLSLEPNIVCMCPDVYTKIQLVSEGIGAAILPEIVASSMAFNNRITIKKVSSFSVESEVTVIWLKDRDLPKSAKRFIEIFQNNEIGLEQLISDKI